MAFFDSLGKQSQPAVIDQTPENAGAVVAPAPGAALPAVAPLPQPAAVGSPPRPARPGLTDSALVKFGIGFLAGGCAVIFPRFLAQLAQSEDLAVIFFPRPYLMLALAVAIVIGLVMMIFEYQVLAKPRETFMTALGLPAVIAGALGTASSLGNISNIKNDAERVHQEVRQDLGIAKSGSFTSFEAIQTKSPAPTPSKRSSLLPAIISDAYAQSATTGQAPDNEPLRFGIQVRQPRYVVVLKQASTAEEAVRDAQAMKERLPTAQAVKTNTGYFVVLGDAPRSETDALLTAARAKKALGNENLRPVLVEVK